MNRSDLLKFHAALCNEANAIMQKKNHDYAGGQDETTPFLNFTRVESLGIVPTEIGIMCRMTDKFSRLITMVQGHDALVSDESLRDTCIDFVNYIIIVAAYLDQKHRKEVSQLERDLSVNPALKKAVEEANTVLDRELHVTEESGNPIMEAAINAHMDAEDNPT